MVAPPADISVDRRKYVRFVPGCEVFVKLCLNEVELCPVTLLSQGGLSVVSKTDLPSGSYISSKVIFPGEDELNLDVRLAWKGEGISETDYRRKMGFVILGRKDFDKYVQVLDRFQKRPIFERRALEERRSLPGVASADGRSTGQVLESLSSLKEHRSFGRRGAPNFENRLYLETQGLDRWSRYHAYERVIDSSGGSIVVTGMKPKIMLGSNSYLGLSDHPKVKEAAIKAVERYGVGTGGARVLSGTTDLHKRLEEKLAKFKGTEACLIFPTGYITNFSVLTALIRKGDVVFNDQVNHASIIDGCRMSEGTVRFYRHNDMGSLENKLKQYLFDKPKLIVTDGVFSMDGDMADLPGIVRLAKRYNATVMLDDAHAIGVLGARGTGTAEHQGVSDGIDLTIATFSKALGGMGGAVCGSSTLIKFIHYHSRQFIFSTSIAPSACASSLAAIEVIESEPHLMAKLHQNRDFLYAGLKGLGYNALETQTAIIPVLIGNERKTYALTHLLDEMGVFVNAVARPSVPRELSRLRVSVMASQSEDQLSQALEAFRRAGKQLGIL